MARPFLHKVFQLKKIKISLLVDSFMSDSSCCVEERSVEDRIMKRGNFSRPLSAHVHFIKTVSVCPGVCVRSFLLFVEISFLNCALPAGLLA